MKKSPAPQPTSINRAELLMITDLIADQTGKHRAAYDPKIDAIRALVQSAYALETGRHRNEVGR